jgi:hypothetical protein
MATSRPPAQLGELIEEDIDLFRAFAEKSFRERKSSPPHRVKYGAFLLREEDVADGLSVGLTPQASVKFLVRNYGYGSILVKQVTSMMDGTVSDGLTVRRDVSDPEHAFICNLPLLTTSDIARDAAMRIAKELARRATGVTCDTYIPK